MDQANMQVEDSTVMNSTVADSMVVDNIVDDNMVLNLYILIGIPNEINNNKVEYLSYNCNHINYYTCNVDLINSIYYYINIFLCKLMIYISINLDHHLARQLHKGEH